jgi:hypothetical protein
MESRVNGVNIINKWCYKRKEKQQRICTQSTMRKWGVIKSKILGAEGKKKKDDLTD